MRPTIISIDFIFKKKLYFFVEYIVSFFFFLGSYLVRLLAVVPPKILKIPKWLEAKIMSFKKKISA